MERMLFGTKVVSLAVSEVTLTFYTLEKVPVKME